MANLQLNYLYRDGANYKQFDFVIFTNPNGLALQDATILLRSKLISEEYFIPQDWKLPRLHFHPYNPEIDHEWHEFESFEETSTAPTDNRDISEFLKKIEKGYEI
jgi:hypothetical protein